MSKNNTEEHNKQAIKTFTAYKKTFSGPDGELVLKDLMREGNFLGTTFVAGDPYHSAYSEGARSLVVRIIEQLGMDLEEYLNRMEITQEGEEDDDIHDRDYGTDS